MNAQQVCAERTQEPPGQINMWEMLFGMPRNISWGIFRVLGLRGTLKPGKWGFHSLFAIACNHVRILVLGDLDFVYVKQNTKVWGFVLFLVLVFWFRRRCLLVFCVFCINSLFFSSFLAHEVTKLQDGAL